MKKTILLFLLVFCAYAFALAQEKNYCRIGQDPADPDKKIDWAEECLVKASKEVKIIMTTGSGRQVSCILPPLTPVVVEKSTGVAKWIYNCGNKIISPSEWIPDGVKQCGPEPQPQIQNALQEIKEIKLQPGTLRVEGEITHRVEVGGEIRHTHSGEVNIVNIEERKVPQKNEPLAYKKSWWQKNRKWLIPFAIGGAAAGGYAAARGKKNSSTVYYQPLPPPLVRP
ncbi:MAG: hypothetical protein ACP5QN_02695 [Minisyncoccia bacterium]